MKRTFVLMFLLLLCACACATTDKWHAPSPEEQTKEEATKAHGADETLMSCLYYSITGVLSTPFIGLEGFRGICSQKMPE